MPKVLIVDDSGVDRRFVCELLRKQSEWTVLAAANGAEALERMKDTPPDLVVTDLSMPVMDGLELVIGIRQHHPGVPIILMTAYGSETLATEALQLGASSYVPKAQLVDKLLDTMEEVLGLARADRSHERLIHCLASSNLTFCLENDPALIDPLVDMIQQMVTGVGLADFTGRLRIGVALKEALLNSLFHGNLEMSREQARDIRDNLLEDEGIRPVEKRRLEPPYRDRKIFMEVALSASEARFVIRDQGPGFDVTSVPHPSDPGALEPEKGRGLSLMRSFMDEVVFNEVGNEVTMVWRPEEGLSPDRRTIA